MVFSPWLRSGRMGLKWRREMEKRIKMGGGEIKMENEFGEVMMERKEMGVRVLGEGRAYKL